MGAILGSLETWVYTAVAAGVMTWASHNPTWHDPALWLLGVIGHALGIAHARAGIGGNGAPE